MRMQRQRPPKETLGVRWEVSAWDLLFVLLAMNRQGKQSSTAHTTQIESIEQLCAEWNTKSQSLFK